MAGALLALALLCGGPAAAAGTGELQQPPAQVDLLSGESYLTLPEYDRQLYVAGLNDAYSWSYTGGFAKLRWMGPCVHGRTPRQLAAMFTKWLEDNPERWHEPAPKLFTFAIFELCEARAAR